MRIVNQVQFQYCWLYLVWVGISSRESELGCARGNLPAGIARALFATTLAQASVAVIALIIWKPPVTSGVLEVLGVNAFFVALFVGSALLFRYAGRGRTPAGAGPGG